VTSNKQARTPVRVLANAMNAGQACAPFHHAELPMSKQANILQILPANGWVAVYDESGEESAAALVCFALVETLDGGNKTQEVRPMCADGKRIVFADDAANFVRVEELAEFEEGEEDEEEDDDAED
jgi:hypothetical protein